MAKRPNGDCGVWAMGSSGFGRCDGTRAVRCWIGSNPRIVSNLTVAGYRGGRSRIARTVPTE